MKKPFLAELFLVILFLCSCSTTKDNLIHDYLLQAEDYYLSDNLQKASELCAEGYSKTGDYRLLFNRSIYLALQKDYNSAVSVCILGYSEFPDKKEFLNSALEFLILADNKTQLYSLAIDEWNAGNTSKEVISALYYVDPSEWRILYESIN